MIVDINDWILHTERLDVVRPPQKSESPPMRKSQQRDMNNSSTLVVVSMIVFALLRPLFIRENGGSASPLENGSDLATSSQGLQNEMRGRRCW